MPESTVSGKWNVNHRIEPKMGLVTSIPAVGYTLRDKPDYHALSAHAMTIASLRLAKSRMPATFGLLELSGMESIEVSYPRGAS